MAKGKPKDVEAEEISFFKENRAMIHFPCGNKRLGAHKNTESGSMASLPNPEFFSHLI